MTLTSPLIATSESKVAEAPTRRSDPSMSTSPPTDMLLPRKTAPPTDRDSLPTISHPTLKKSSANPPIVTCLFKLTLSLTLRVPNIPTFALVSEKSAVPSTIRSKPTESVVLITASPARESVGTISPLPAENRSTACTLARGSCTV